MKRAVFRFCLIVGILATANLIPSRAQEASGPGRLSATQSAPPARPASSHPEERVLLTFPGAKNGGNPTNNLIFDSRGNLYGTTRAGGGLNSDCPNAWCGMAFELTPTSNGKWKETVLHDFNLGKDRGGAVPSGGLIFDSAGNLYGTTENGGRGNCSSRCGVVFELTPTSPGKWKETVLYAFSGRADGGTPSGGVIFDVAGNLYGETAEGSGVVYKLTPKTDGSWTEKVLYAFTGGKNGNQPSGNLIFDAAAGTLYGTTSSGGRSNCGCGVVFELLPGSNGKWSEKVLHRFSGISEGGYPNGDLIFDTSGNLYGTTILGGNRTDCQGYGCGVVFKLTPTSSGGWKEIVLYTFTGGKDGAGPAPGPTFDAAGDLYGTTFDGGIANCAFGCGVAFKLTPTPHGEWKEVVLHSFTGGNDGGNPGSGLILDVKGNLYGSAVNGGVDGWGVVFDLVP
jgi:hypothetical protein